MMQTVLGMYYGVCPSVYYDGDCGWNSSSSQELQLSELRVKVYLNLHAKGYTSLCDSDSPVCHHSKQACVILLKTGQNCDIEGKNSECEFFNVIIWK